MAQTPALFVKPGLALAYLASSDKIAGEVVVIGTRPLIVSAAIDFSLNPLGTVRSNGAWDVPQAAEIIQAGDRVYWDENGTPVTGTALSGAATATATGNNLIGTAVPLQPNGTSDTAATDTYVRVDIDGTSLNIATVGGSMTADDITGSDSSLAIAGISAAQGGTVSVTGGTSSTAGNAGGAASLIGGVPGTTSSGGAVAIAGGATIAGVGGTGGAVTITGGANANTTNGAGGPVTTTGGAGKGTGAGGAVGLVGGASGTGATGAGGAVSITGGEALSTNDDGGDVILTPGVGNGTGENGVIRNLGLATVQQGAPTAETTTATLTIAGLLTKIITGTHAAGATQAYTLPTGTLMSGGVATATGDSFDWTIINLSAAAADTITLTAGATHTIVGNPIVQSAHVSTGGITGNSAVFRSRMTAATTWITYRIG
jgi:hypothetical protein